MGNFRTKSWMDAEAVKKFFVTYYRIGSYTKNYEYTNVTLVSSSNQKLGGFVCYYCQMKLMNLVLYNRNSFYILYFFTYIVSRNYKRKKCKENKLDIDYN